MDLFLAQNALLQNAVLQDALLGLGLIAGSVLILGTKREIRRETRRREKALEVLAAKVEALPLERKRTAMEPAVAGPSTTDANVPLTNPDVIADAVPLRSGVNLNWRVQALRLLRRGQDIAHVSTALGVPRREIELLIRVHQLASGRAPSRLG